MLVAIVLSTIAREVDRCAVIVVVVVVDLHIHGALIFVRCASHSELP